MRETLAGHDRKFLEEKLSGLKHFYLYDFSVPQLEHERGFCVFLKTDSKKPSLAEEVKAWLKTLGPSLDTSPKHTIFDESLYVCYSETGSGGLPHIDAKGTFWARIDEQQMKAVLKLDDLFEKAGFQSIPLPDYYRGHSYPEV